MRISVRGVGIEVDDQGLTSGEPLLLIMGLGWQLLLRTPAGAADRLSQKDSAGPTQALFAQSGERTAPPLDPDRLLPPD